MIQSSLDILYLSLALGFIVLVVFTSVMMMYLIMILRDITKVVDNAKDITDKVNEYIVSPVRIASQVAVYMKPVLEAVVNRFESQKESSASRKKK